MQAISSSCLIEGIRRPVAVAGGGCRSTAVLRGSTGVLPVADAATRNENDFPARGSGSSHVGRAASRLDGKAAWNAENDSRRAA